MLNLRPIRIENQIIRIILISLILAFDLGKSFIYVQSSVFIMSLSCFNDSKVKEGWVSPFIFILCFFVLYYPFRFLKHLFFIIV